MNKYSEKFPLLNNTINTLKNIAAYDLHTARVVFEHEGDEIVFINESLLGRVRVYFNGDLAYSGWDWTGMVVSRGWFLHQGKTYKIKSVINNLLTFSQRVTLSIGDQEIETKIGELYGKLSLKEIAHLALGGAFLGFAIVSVIKLFGI